MTAVFILAIGGQSANAQPADDTTVYHAPGKKRVHVKECRRFAGEEGKTKMTLAEAQREGLQLCSKCPGSTTDRGASNQNIEASDKPAGDTTVYYNPGKKRVHVMGCRRLTTDPDELAAREQMTLAEAETRNLPLCSRCPGSTTGKGESGKGNQANDKPAADTAVYSYGGKRVHVKECRRFQGEQGATEMTFAEAKSKGLQLCSKCPGNQISASGAGLPESWVNPAPDTVQKAPFSPSKYEPLVSVGSDGKLVYQPYSEQGDRILDWSTCGYRMSEVPIPDVAVVKTLEPLPGEPKASGNMAYPSGADSRARIQDALDQVAASDADADGIRGAVLLKKGTYYLDGTIRVRSGVVLRGEGDGPEGTTLVFSGGNGKETAIQVGEPDAKIRPIEGGKTVRIADAYVPSGSSQLTLVDAGQFKAGDYVGVRKTVNQQWIDDLGMGERLRHIRGGKEGLKKRPWQPKSYQFVVHRQIENVSGDRITFKAMLPQSFDEKHGGGEVFPVSIDTLARQSGVESLSVVSNFDTTVTDTSKQANYKNYNSGIMLSAAMNSWVRKCTVLHVSFAAVRTGSSTMFLTVRDAKSLKPVGPRRGGKRYAFSIGGGTLHLFYNCYSEDGRHDFVGGSREQGPFAFVQCTAVRGGQSEPHHRWGTGFLYDRVTNKDGNLAAINRGDSGSGHGWAAANTLFWNCDAKSVVVFDPETPGENNFAIGFTGDLQGDYDFGGLMYANNRAGYWGTQGEGKYYGYALMGGGHIESPDGPVKPDSLFEQQLIDRIGKDRAAAVLK